MQGSGCDTIQVVSENPFLEYLISHPRADAGALKELYRILAKRTHPDTSSKTDDAFARLQDAYHQALAHLVEQNATHLNGGHAPRGESAAAAPRTRTLQALYRYVACIPRREIDVKPVHPRCASILSLAITAAGSYREQAQLALEAYKQQFHRLRAATARYPDVRTKYACLMDGLRAFFEYQLFESPLTLRIARSYLNEIRPVSDYDPSGDPALRTNRSAAARAALFLMRAWIEAELELPPASLL